MNFAHGMVLAINSKQRMEINRYISLICIYHRALGEKEIWFIFSDMLNHLFGIKGSLEMGLFLSWAHPSSQPIAIFRCNNKHINKFMTLTYWIRFYQGKHITFIPWKISGTIKSAKDKLANADMKKIVSELQI